MGPTWVLSAPDGPHVGLMNLIIWVGSPVYCLAPLHTCICVEVLLIQQLRLPLHHAAVRLVEQFPWLSLTVATFLKDLLTLIQVAYSRNKTEKSAWTTYMGFWNYLNHGWHPLSPSRRLTSTGLPVSLKGKKGFWKGSFFRKKG